MTLDGITTKITYSNALAEAQKANDAKAANVVVPVGQGSENASQVAENTTSKLDELLEKLCAEFSKYGLKAQELKNSGILYRITGLNEEQLIKASDQELKQVINCLKEAIKDSVVDGKVDLENVGKVANNYYIAVKTGWTIDGYKAANKRSAESLSARLERFYGLKEGSFANLSQEKVQECLTRYFNDFYVQELKNAKTQTEKEKIYKKQLQDFGKLLTNTPDSEKAIFKQAITALVASNRVKGLDAVLASFDTPNARTAWADSWTVEETRAMALTSDVEGNTMAQAEVTEATAKVTAVKSEQGITEHHAEFQKSAQKFFEDNKEALAKIAEKEANGEALTEEEKQLKLERDSFYTAVAAGEISGTAINEIVSSQAKEEILATMNADAYKNPNYKEVLKQVTDFVENHPEVLTGSKEAITKVLDKATNGNYTRVATSSNEELKAPASQTENVGATEIVNTKSEKEIAALQQSLLQRKAELKANSEEVKQNFIVEKSEKVTAAQVYKMENDAIRSAANINEYLDVTGESKFGFAETVFKNFSKAGKTTQVWATSYFSNLSSATQKLFAQKLTNSRSGMLAIAKDVDLSKFNLIGVSVTTQKEIDKIQRGKCN